MREIYRATRCPCGDSHCKDWHVSNIAAVQGVRMTEAQARAVADALNTGRQRLSDGERATLVALGELCWEPDIYYTFRRIADEHEGLKPDVPEVRRRVRSLARKGLAFFRGGLFNEDGEVAGGGYAITALGRLWLEENAND